MEKIKILKKKIKSKKIKLKNIFLKISIKIINIIIPKDDKIILIGGWFGERFLDNSRYIYLYLNINLKKYNLKKVIFVTKNREVYDYIKSTLKYEVYMMYSIKSIFYHLKAKYYIIDQNFQKDLIGWLGINTIKINLWHGFPLKKIGYLKGENPRPSVGNLDNYYLLTCSKLGDSIIGDSFKCPKNKRFKGMYPRNYFLKSESENYLLPKKEKNVLGIINREKLKGKKIIIYLPTFRDKEKLIFLGESSLKKIELFFNFLKENNYFLITKVHFAGTNIISKNRDNILIKNENFFNIESSVDIYSILKMTDILITDYSSVYFDYLYLNKRIIFYPYDLEYYKTKDRGLNFDYNEITPGEKVYNLEELKESLKKKEEKKYIYSRKKVLEKCFENYTIEETIDNILKIGRENEKNNNIWNI